MFRGFRALLREIRRAPCRRCEASVAFAAPAAFQQHFFISFFVHIRNDDAAFLILNDRAQRYVYDKVFAAFSKAVSALSVFAVFRAEMFFEFEVDKCIQVVVDAKHDIAAVTAVAAVGPALLDELFTMERHNPVAAVTGFTKYRYVIKHNLSDAAFFAAYYFIIYND